MKFPVLWSPAAEASLARIWMESEQPSDVTRAAYAIDRILQHNPESAGESRPDGTRIVFSPPLGAIFSIRTEEQCTVVLKVWSFGKPRTG